MIGFLLGLIIGVLIVLTIYFFESRYRPDMFKTFERIANIRERPAIFDDEPLIAEIKRNDEDGKDTVL